MEASALHECTPDIRVVEDGVQFSSFTGGNLLAESLSQPFTNYCSPCDIHFEDLTEFDYHIAKLHKPVKTPKPQVEKVYICSMCDLSFRRHDHLKRHIRSLHHAKSYSKCPVCSKEFPEREVMAQHIKKVHAGRKETYNCRECNFQCDNLKSLLIHEVDHMERHVCPHCSMSYKRRDHMTRHVKSEHMKLVVKCSLCKQIYKRKDHLARHMREKHKDSDCTLSSHYVINN